MMMYGNTFMDVNYMIFMLLKASLLMRTPKFLLMKLFLKTFILMVSLISLVPMIPNFLFHFVVSEDVVKKTKMEGVFSWKIKDPVFNIVFAVMNHLFPDITQDHILL